MGSERTITVEVDSVREYLHTLNGVLGLTDSEIDVLSEFAGIQLRYGNDDPIGVFSSASKKRVAKNLNFNNYHSVNNYIKSLTRKGMLEKLGDGSYKIREMLIPNGETVLRIQGSESEGGFGL